MITFENIRDFCSKREVDLVLVPPPTPFTMCLHGEFDGHGDFFAIAISGIEYVEFSTGITVGDIAATQSVGRLAELSPNWLWLAERYSAQAIAIRSADSTQWGSKGSDFVIVANEIKLTKGKDWI